MIHKLKVILIPVLFLVGSCVISAKTLTNEAYYSQGTQSTQTYQQNSNPAQYPQQGSYQSPSYPEYDENMESYEYPSSEEAHMPVKNNQYVPIESPRDANSTGNGFIPQRQVSLQEFWQQHMLYQNNKNNEGVTDEGDIYPGSVSANNSSNIHPNNVNIPPEDASLPHYYLEQQYQPQQPYQTHFYQEEQQAAVSLNSTSSSTFSPLPSPAPTPKKKSNVHKLVVVARRTVDGKIAVVKDKFRAARQRRSMMTLSREDENDSEYDDLENTNKAVLNMKNNTSTKTTDKIKH